MIHGGIRYLQHADVRRVRHSARARATYLRVAPHLVKPLPIVVPTYGRGMKSKVRAAGRHGRLRHAHVRPQSRYRRSCRANCQWHHARAREVLRRYPGLDPAGLTGAGIFCDGQMHNPPRLVLAFVQSAVAAGAVCANYVEVTGLIQRAGHVAGVVARDVAGGDRLEIRGRFVLNAAGPYAERLLTGSLGQGLSPPTPFSRDAYFIVGGR